MADINKVAEALFEKIRDRFSDVSLGDDKAKATQNPEKARFFNFDYEVDNKTHGNITLSLIDETSLKIYFSTNICNDLSEEEQTKWYSFLRELREFAKRNMLSFEPRDITRSTLKHRDLQHVSKSDSTFNKGELSLGESKLYGSAKKSYESFGPARIVIQHSKPIVDETHGARARNINAIFVENDQGERFKLPFKNMIGARAMARHISAGGNTHDDIGKHITEMVSEYNKLRPFLRNVRTRTFEDAETKEMCEAAAEYHNKLHKQLNQLRGKRGYSAFKESYVADNTLMDDVDVDSLKNRFVRQVYDNRIDEALPIVNKAHKMKTSSKLAAQFESWANGIVEGTLESDESTALKELFKEPLVVGVDGVNAIAAIEGLVAGDQLVSALTELASYDTEADARQTIADWLEGEEPELYAEIFGEERPNFEEQVGEAINWPKEVPTDSGFSGEQQYDDDEENDPHPYNTPPNVDRLARKIYGQTEGDVDVDRFARKIYGLEESEGLEEANEWQKGDNDSNTVIDDLRNTSETTNNKLQSYIGKHVYVKSAGTGGEVIQVSPTHRNSLVIALDNGQQTVAHFTDVSDEKPGTIRHVLDKFNALTGGNPSKSPTRTQRATPGTSTRDFAESDDNEPDYCPSCAGTGEGQYDGTRCSHCGGSGVLKDKSEDGPEYEKFNESLALLKRYIKH